MERTNAGSGTTNQIVHDFTNIWDDKEERVGHPIRGGEDGKKKEN